MLRRSSAGKQGVGGASARSAGRGTGPIAQGHDVVHEAIGQDVGFNPALEQIVGRLYDMQGWQPCEKRSIWATEKNC